MENVYGAYGGSLKDDDEIELETLVWNESNDEINEEQKEQRFLEIGESNYTDDDIVECEYDGGLSQFRMSKVENDNGKETICVFKIKLTNDDSKYYYPVISLRDENDSVEIM